MGIKMLPSIKGANSTSHDIYSQIKGWTKVNNRVQEIKKSNQIFNQFMNNNYKDNTKYDIEYKLRHNPSSLQGNQYSNPASNVELNISKQLTPHVYVKENIKKTQEFNQDLNQGNKYDISLQKTGGHFRNPKLTSIKGGNVHTAIFPKHTQASPNTKLTVRGRLESQQFEVNNTKNVDKNEWFLPDQNTILSDKTDKNDTASFTSTTIEIVTETASATPVHEDIVINKEDISPEEQDYFKSIRKELGSVTPLRSLTNTLSTTKTNSIRLNRDELPSKMQNVSNLDANLASYSQIQSKLDSSSDLKIDQDKPPQNQNNTDLLCVKENSVLKINIKETKQDSPIKAISFIKSIEKVNHSLEVSNNPALPAVSKNKFKPLKTDREIKNRKTSINKIKNQKLKERDYFQPIHAPVVPPVRHAKSNPPKVTNFQPKHSSKEPGVKVQKNFMRKKVIQREPPTTIRYPTREEALAARARKQQEMVAAAADTSLTLSPYYLMALQSQQLQETDNVSLPLFHDSKKQVNSKHNINTLNKVVLTIEQMNRHEQNNLPSKLKPFKELANQISQVKHRSSELKTQSSDTQNQTSDTHNLSSDTHNLSSDTHNLSSDTHNLSSDTHNLLSDNQTTSKPSDTATQSSNNQIRNDSRQTLDKLKSGVDLQPSEATEEEIQSMELLLRVSDKCFVKKSRANVRTA